MTWEVVRNPIQSLIPFWYSEFESLGWNSELSVLTSSPDYSGTHKAENHWWRTNELGDPWVAQQFSACLRPRVWSWRPGIKSHIRLPAWNLLLPLPVSLPLSLFLSLSLCVCLSWINKILKKYRNLIKHLLNIDLVTISNSCEKKWKLL